MCGNGGRENTFMVSWRAIKSRGARETTQKLGRWYLLSEKKRTGGVEEGSSSKTHYRPARRGKGSVSSTQGSHH